MKLFGDDTSGHYSASKKVVLHNHNHHQNGNKQYIRCLLKSFERAVSRLIFYIVSAYCFHFVSSFVQFVLMLSSVAAGYLHFGWTDMLVAIFLSKIEKETEFQLFL